MRVLIFFVFAFSICFLGANPIVPAVLSELYFEDGSWILEIYDYYQIFELLDLNGAYLTTSAGTAYFNNGISFNSNMVFVVDESDLQESLPINPEGDNIIFAKDPEIFDQISFGSNVNPPNASQSLARMIVYYGPPLYSEGFRLVKENQPSIGYDPFTISSYGTFTGYVFDSLYYPVENVQLEYNPGLGYYFPQIITDENGHFETELPGMNYIFTIHLAALASLPDTTITIEPDSIHTYEFVFENYVHSDDHEVELPSSFYELTNSPNPFNPSTEINFNLTTEITENTEIQIFNSKGQQIKQLVSDQLSAGQNTITWDGDDENGKPVSSGVYFYKLVSEKKELAANKMLLLK